MQIPFIQLLEKSELSWTLEALQRETREGKRVGFLLAFHWKHPPHLSCSPKMEALRLLFKKLPCCYWKTSSRDKTGIAKCFLMVIKEISEFKVLQPWTSQIKKSTLGSKWSNQEFKFFDWKKVEKAWLCYFNFWSKEYLQKIDPFITQTFWNFGIFCVPLPYLGNQVKTTMKFMFSGSFTSFPPHNIPLFKNSSHSNYFIVPFLRPLSKGKSSNFNSVNKHV